MEVVGLPGGEGEGVGGAGGGGRGVGFYFPRGWRGGVGLLASGALRGEGGLFEEWTCRYGWCR